MLVHKERMPSVLNMRGVKERERRKKKEGRRLARLALALVKMAVALACC